MIVSGHEISVVDGMDEKGQVANGLWLADAGYREDDGIAVRQSDEPGIAALAVPFTFEPAE